MHVSLIAAIALLSAASVQGAPSRQIIGVEQDHSLAGATSDCEHFFRTTFTSFSAQVHEREQRDIPAPRGQQLRVIARHEGGVSIRGWNRPQARLVACSYAAALTRPQATTLLESLTISETGGEIVVDGPAIDETRAWWVNLILYVPKQASVEVTAANGGIAVRDMGGQVNARATSGGISIANSTGRYRVTTDSGGITLDHVDGTVEATSKDGTIAVKLPPENYPTVEAKTAGGGHILCNLKGCEGRAAIWGAGGHLLRIGTGIPGIRVSTGAPIIIGPVTN
jgi:DUF4097 and DUF4098 domain-containing protein YvlB